MRRCAGFPLSVFPVSEVDVSVLVQLATLRLERFLRVETDNADDPLATVAAVQER